MQTDERSFCQATWDLLLCWPPTPAGQTSYLPCPPYKGIDPTSAYILFSSLVSEKKIRDGRASIRDVPRISIGYLFIHATFNGYSFDKADPFAKQ